MKFKSVFVTLGVIAILASANGTAVDAKSHQTDKKTRAVKQKVVTVKAGDTLESIANKHKTTYVHLFNANPSIEHPDSIDVSDKITIPAKGKKFPDRISQLAPVIAPVATVAQATPTAPVTYTTQQYSSAPVDATSYYVGNGMWCTDYVHSKRPDVSIYGNAGYNWVSAAQAEGKSTGSVPQVGAVAVTNGHVAYVEKVNSDGSYVVSEMGWNYQAGNYNERTVQPGSFGRFIY
jgi:surface antigen